MFFQIARFYFRIVNHDLTIMLHIIFYIRCLSNSFKAANVMRI